VDARARLYKKIGHRAVHIAEVVRTQPPEGGQIFGQRALTPPGSALAEKTEGDCMSEKISARLMAQFVPTCLVLNAKHEIVHSFGEPQRVIGLRAGQATLNVLKLVPRELAVALSLALRRAEKEKETIAYRRVRFQRESGKAIVNLKVEPLPAEPGEPAVVLVFFEELKRAPAPVQSIDYDACDKSVQRFADLEEDLRSTREHLQRTLEEKGVANEELQATNEELLASNEELQSSNEELESVNEELTTLNSEYQHKIAELTSANNDLENFLRTSNVSTIFLDSALRIRRFTDAAAIELRLLPHDAGRLLTDIPHPVARALAVALPRATLATQQFVRSVETSPGVWHLLRITPYRREGASDQGWVISIVNLSDETNSPATKPRGKAARVRAGAPARP
nr:PAS domain-containing protein [Verrucomicrobiota bacterium]